jgi:hypothetical protein
LVSLPDPKVHPAGVMETVEVRRDFLPYLDVRGRSRAFDAAGRVWKTAGRCRLSQPDAHVDLLSVDRA